MHRDVVTLGVVVEDCLQLLLNLLKNNLSNQNFLKEGSYIQRLPTYFDLSSMDKSPNEGWSAQKVTNVHLMLEVNKANEYNWCHRVKYIVI